MTSAIRDSETRDLTMAAVTRCWISGLTSVTDRMMMGRKGSGVDVGVGAEGVEAAEGASRAAAGGMRIVRASGSVLVFEREYGELSLERHQVLRVVGGASLPGLPGLIVKTP